MGILTYKAGYIKGLCESLGASPAESILRQLGELLYDISEKVETNDDKLNELDDFVGELDDALADVEDELGPRNDLGEGLITMLNGLADESPKPKRMKTAAAKPAFPAFCPECKGVFMVEGSLNRKYVCPHCSRAVSPDLITTDNAPKAKPQTR